MRKQKKRNRETRRLHIACDMDGSIASFVHGTKIDHQRVPIPEWYKTALLEAIKREILQTSTEDCCQDTLITMKLFTLRKDKPTDQIIALRNKTNLACKILEQFSNSLEQIIDPRTCAITVDSQYHHNQLFGSTHGATYTEGIHCIDTQNQNSAPWAKQSFFHTESAREFYDYPTKENRQVGICGHDKLDLILTTAWSMAGTVCQTLVILDDKLFAAPPLRCRDTLTNLVRFIAHFPSLIPENINIKFYRFIPKSDMQRKATNTQDKTSTAIIDQNELELRHWLAQQCADQGNNSTETGFDPRDFLNPLLIKHEDLAKWFNHYQQALHHVHTVQGEQTIDGVARPDGNGSINFWKQVLIPAAIQYLRFIQTEENGYISDYEATLKAR